MKWFLLEEPVTAAQVVPKIEEKPVEAASIADRAETQSRVPFPVSVLPTQRKPFSQTWTATGSRCT